MSPTNKSKSGDLKIYHPTSQNLQWIIQNMEKGLISPFQCSSVKKLHEISPWSLLAVYENENKAYAAFLDYPCEDHFSQVWYQSIEQKWKKSPYYGVKTLFLHFLVSDNNVKTFLKEILKKTFRTISSLQWCCILVKRPSSIDPNVMELFIEDKSMGNKEFQFWATERSAYVEQIGIRRKESEDYVALKNMFSYMFGPFKNEDLKKFTLDFIDYGEDRCPTYKYFTFDDDNTYIGIADNYEGEAIGFIYATTRRIDLDILHEYFQLESVYGLRKKHPSDKPELSFGTDGSSSEDSSDEENNLREFVESLIDEIEFDCEISMCVNDIIDEICDKPKFNRRKQQTYKQLSDQMRFLNVYKEHNSLHSLLTSKKSIKNIPKDTLVYLINSSDFDVKNKEHMQLVLHLGEAIKNVREDRIKEIVSSESFEPSKTDYAKIALHVISHLSEQKFQQFKKSSVGSKLYEKLMYEKALEKQSEISKSKKNVKTPKLSFKDTQIILHHANDSIRIKNIAKRKIPEEKKIQPENMKNISFRNMGFISGSNFRVDYKMQDNILTPNIQKKTDDEKEQVLDSQLKTGDEIPNRYPILDKCKDETLFQEIPEYYGGTNCIYVEQFAIKENYDYQSLLLIMAAFDNFPQMDYCILLLPYGTAMVSFLQSYFFSMPARPFRSCGKELFVFHKATFNRTYEVRNFIEEDLKGVERLVNSSCLKEHLLADVRCSLSSVDTQTIVMLSEGQILGVAVVRKLKEVETIQRNYNVSELINTKYHKSSSNGQLLHCVLHPIFKYLSNMFLKQIMYLSQKSILYYKVYPTRMIWQDPSLWQSLCNVLENMFPLKPMKRSGQKIKSYIVFTSNDNSDSEKKKEESINCCISYTSINVVLKEKRTISSRIVVIGFSHLMLGVLESLIYRHDCKFTNISIVSKYGMPGDINLDEKCSTFLPMDTDYTDFILDGLCLSTWVTIIRAEIQSIKRNELELKEYASTSSNCFSVEYDFLILCDDAEFQNLYVKKSVPEEYVQSEDQSFSPLTELPLKSAIIKKETSNVFTVNNRYEAAIVLNWLWKYFSEKMLFQSQTKKKYKSLADKERRKREGRIVIYGNFLEAYTALAVILSENFPQSKITYIKESSCDLKPFHTSLIEKAVDHVISKLGIQIISNAAIEYEKEIKEVTTLNVTDDNGADRLDCCALILFHQKKINYSTFKILHKSSLSFTFPVSNNKGHPYLLINSKFQTNQSNVFAAGTLTEMHVAKGQYVRFEDCTYNKREVGLQVGENVSKILLKKLCPKKEFPIFTLPEITHAKLPDSYNYIFITSPAVCFRPQNYKSKIKYRIKTMTFGNLHSGSQITPALLTEEESLMIDSIDSQEQVEFEEFLAELKDIQQAESKETEDEIKEYPLPDKPEYFAFVFDENEDIESIECLTKKEIDVHILKKLHGTHVTELHKSFQKVVEADMLSFYLAENWILPLDHLTFEEDEIKPKRRGYEGYWRPGYPKYIESKLNTFLNSFVNYKGNKK